MGGDRRLRFAAAVMCVVLSAACGDDDGGSPAAAIDVCVEGRWVSHGGTAANQRHGCNETALSPDTVADLEEKWRITPGSVVGTPAVYDGVVYFGSMDMQIHAVEAETGDEIWATPIEGGVQSSLLVTESSVYVVDLGPPGRAFAGDAATPPQIYRLDRAEGEILAQVDYDSHPFSVGWSSPVYVEESNLVILGVASFEVFIARGARTFHGKLLGLNGDTLAQEWVFDVNAPEYGPGVSVWSSPAIDTELNRVYVGTGQGYEHPVTPLSDALIAVDYETGELAWSEQYTADDTYVLGGGDGPDYDVGAPPTLFDLEDGTPAIGVGDKEGTFHVHDRRNGDLIWETKITPGSALGGVMQSAAFEDGAIYVISNKVAGGNPSLFALDAEAEGAEIWNVDLGDISVFGAISVVNGVIYFGDMNGELQVRRATDGSVIWNDPHEVAADTDQRDVEAIAAGISIVDGTIYVPFGAQSIPTSYFTSATAAPLGGGVAAYHVP